MHFMIVFIQNFQEKNTQRHEVDWWFPGNASKFNEKELLMGIGLVSFGVMKMFYN